MKKSINMPIRAVFYRDEGKVFAHCLEFDLIGDGATQHEAMQSLTEAIAIQVMHTLQHGNSKNLFFPADSRLFEMFSQGKEQARCQLSLHFEVVDYEVDIPEIETREYRDGYEDVECDDLVPA